MVRFPGTEGFVPIRVYPWLKIRSSGCGRLHETISPVVAGLAGVCGFSTGKRGRITEVNGDIAKRHAVISKDAGGVSGNAVSVSESVMASTGWFGFISECVAVRTTPFGTISGQGEGGAKRSGVIAPLDA